MQMHLQSFLILLAFFAAGVGGTESPALAEAKGINPVPTVPLAVPLAVTLEKYAEGAISGGPRRDGIPSIDDPRFITRDEAERYLRSDDIVFGVVLKGEARAYPQRILVWHEIVNDTIGGEAIAVTYCPLTGTAIGFKRGTTTFGVSGRLVNNNLIMYDRSTESLWPQILATAVEGPLKGRSLMEFPVTWTTWELWQKAHPDTHVLSTDTGYARNYFSDPYGNYNPVGGYYRPEAPPLFPVMHKSDRFPPKAVMIGARSANAAVAFSKEVLRNKKIVTGVLDSSPIVAIYDSSLDTVHLYRNPARLSITHDGNRIVSDNGSWNPGNLPLKRIKAFDAMWFAWYAFFPGTKVYE